MRNVGHFVFISMSGKNSMVDALGLLRSVLRNRQPNTASESGRAPVFMFNRVFFCKCRGSNILRHLNVNLVEPLLPFIYIYIYISGPTKFTFYLWNSCLFSKISITGITAVTPSSALMRPRSRYIEAITKWTPSLTRHFQIHLLEWNVFVPIKMSFLPKGSTGHKS